MSFFSSLDTFGNLGSPASAGGGGPGPGPSWHPDDVLSGWKLYLLNDADDLTLGVDTEAGQVIAWANRGTADAQFRQATADNRPMWDAANARVDFDGSNDFMAARNGANIANVTWANLLAANGVGAMVAVVEVDAVASNSGDAFRNDCILGDSAGSAGMHLRSTPVYRPYVYAGGVVDDPINITVPGAAVFGWRKIAHVAATPSFWGSLNGGDEGAGLVADGSGTGFAQQVLLGDTTLTPPLNGKVKLIAVHDTPPSAADFKTLRQNLMTYFGIS